MAERNINVEFAMYNVTAFRDKDALQPTYNSHLKQSYVHICAPQIWRHRKIKCLLFFNISNM